MEDSPCGWSLGYFGEQHTLSLYLEGKSLLLCVFQNDPSENCSICNKIHNNMSHLYNDTSSSGATYRIFYFDIEKLGLGLLGTPFKSTFTDRHSLFKMILFLFSNSMSTHYTLRGCVSTGYILFFYIYINLD